MKQLFITFAALFLAAAFTPTTVNAALIAASSAAFSIEDSIEAPDNRAKLLREYLTKYNSPLAESAETFVKEADRNNLDWKLVVSIAGVESWFGNRIPPNSYNGWGYEVYGNNVRRFASWDEAIEIISRDLREKYMEKWGATDMYSIGRIYATDPMWASKVLHFMNQIEAFKTDPDYTTLSLSI